MDDCREIKNGSLDNYIEDEEIIIETEGDLINRICKFRDFVIKISPKFQRICIISHSHTLRLMTGFIFKNGHIRELSIEKWSNLEMNGNVK